MHRLLSVVALALAMAIVPSPAQAQWVVYDPANYVQAVSRYLQLAQQYQFWLRQARRLPADMAGRYRVPEVTWRTHDLARGNAYARPLLTALNLGDITGALYAQAVDRLEPLESVLGQVPSSLQRRLSAGYATIEMADSIARMGIHQAGTIRTNGRPVLRSIEAMEQDLVASSDSFHTQTALLNKINGANVLGLRIAERTSQFLMHTLEQLLVENKRKRDAEAELMNAHIYQWRYGPAVASDVFRNTARALDDWRQP